MEIKRVGTDHIVFLHDGVATARPMLLVAVACVGLAGLAALFGGAWIVLAGVVVVGGLMLVMLWRASARSAAVFDRERGTLAVTHTRGSAVVGEDDARLADIETVIVEPATGGGAAGRGLALRPSVVAGDRILPLTHGAFETGEGAVAAAGDIRRFLGFSAETLMADSVRFLARHNGGARPAVRLARFGLGLDRDAAEAAVRRFRAGGE